jgi:hypothetical protein
MAVTGHKTLSMVQKYTARTDQKTNARAAMAMLDRTGTERENAKPDEPIAKLGNSTDNGLSNSVVLRQPLRLGVVSLVGIEPTTT